MCVQGSTQWIKKLGGVTNSYTNAATKPTNRDWRRIGGGIESTIHRPSPRDWVPSRFNNERDETRILQSFSSLSLVEEEQVWCLEDRNSSFYYRDRIYRDWFFFCRFAHYQVIFSNKKDVWEEITKENSFVVCPLLLLLFSVQLSATTRMDGSMRWRLCCSLRQQEDREKELVCCCPLLLLFFSPAVHATSTTSRICDDDEDGEIFLLLMMVAACCLLHAAYMVRLVYFVRGWCWGTML